MENIPHILKIAQLEDNVVHQVALCEDGVVAETFYKNVVSDVFQFESQEMLMSSEKASKDKRCKYKISIILSLCLYLGFTVMYIYYFNPLIQIYRYTIFRYGKILPYDLVRPNGQDVLNKCDENIFCNVHFKAMAIKTSKGTLFPNFTKDGNVSGDYYAALWHAAAILSNTSCRSTINITSSDGSVTSNISESIFNLVAEKIYSSIFLIQSKCHHEAVYAINSPNRFSKYKINYKNYMTLPNATECASSWDTVFNKSYYAIVNYTSCDFRYSTLSEVLGFPILVSFQ
ncbi:ORF27 [Felid gammaherpesvirus 1]|uniref:ORF27 n=1 Tax=Felid gammaherpesvirus 1 TaxID=2560468 RepID=A0A0M4LR16_9GAMA|nr:ORF27 [Felis catus gammaherpesvirus 1]ALE14737.1 ORF27 [Felis catus gammaherpesvirus 1]